MPANKTCPSCGAVVGNRKKKCPGPNNDGSCDYVWGAAEAAAAVAAVAEAEAGNDDGGRTSRRARGLSAQIVPPKDKDKADQRSDEARARTRDAKAASYQRKQATLVRCCARDGCGTEKPRSEFWPRELQKGDKARCRACVASDTVEVPFEVVIRAADGTDMATINESDDTDARRWKVVAIGTVDNVEDEPEPARRARALQQICATIGRNGSAHATVVRVDNVSTDYCIPVPVSKDDAGFYATEKAVRRSLAATELGTRLVPRPGTQENLFNTGQGVDWEKACTLGRASA